MTLEQKLREAADMETVEGHRQFFRTLLAAAADANRELVAALEPFAAKLVDVGQDEEDDDLFREMSRENRRSPPITVGHLRAARSALGEG